MTGAGAAREWVVQLLEVQARWCETLGSPLYARLLRAAADDVRAGGPVWSVLGAHADATVASALPLRFLGAVHRLVLAGEAPSLVPFYPSAGGAADGEGAWPAFREVVAGASERLRTMTAAGVQTNEVARCAALVGGFLTVARETGLPLRLLEVGASAGLNLRWDHYRYEGPAGAWGDAASPVRLTGCIADGAVPFDVAATVVARRGCDVNPLDPTTEAGRATLLAYVWPDQTERLALLRGALEVASRVPAVIDASGAADWLDVMLAEPAPGVATVVYHSIVTQYLPDAERERMVDTLRAAGARATADAPLAWLRMEPGGEQAEVRLRVWPGSGSRLVATTGFHGRGVRWLGG
jgi:hypothetical protein